MNRFEQQPRNLEVQVKRLTVSKTIIPHLKSGERFSITVAPFQDHGRPSFIASAIKSHPAILEIARGLTPDESKRANDRLSNEMERILSSEDVRRISVLSAQGKPDIHVITLGDSFDPRGLRIYYTKGEFNGAPIIYQQAIARLKDSTKVERVFIDVGYKAKNDWERRKVH